MKARRYTNVVLLTAVLAAGVGAAMLVTGCQTPGKVLSTETSVACPVRIGKFPSPDTTVILDWSTASLPTNQSASSMEIRKDVHDRSIVDSRTWRFVTLL